MCIIPKQSWFRRIFNAKPRVRLAKEDIKVYKFLQGNGKTLKSYPDPKGRWVIGKVYKQIMVFTKYYYDKLGRPFWHVSEGIHSYTQFHPSDVNYVYNAIIPKGSRYVIGLGCHIMSNQLIIIDKYKK